MYYYTTTQNYNYFYTFNELASYYFRNTLSFRVAINTFQFVSLNRPLNLVFYHELAVIEVNCALFFNRRFTWFKE